MREPQAECCERARAQCCAGEALAASGGGVAAQVLSAGRTKKGRRGEGAERPGQASRARLCFLSKNGKALSPPLCSGLCASLTAALVLPWLACLLQDNLYWLGLLTHLQCDGVPLKSAACLRDLRAMYEAATIEDIYDAYNQVGQRLAIRRATGSCPGGLA